MELLKMMLGCSDFPRMEPISFSETEKGYEIFFKALEEYRSVRYSWKHSALYIASPEGVRYGYQMSQEEFSKAVRRTVTNSIDLLRLLAFSEIHFKIIEWEEIIPVSIVTDLEKMNVRNIGLPAPPEVRRLEQKIILPISNLDLLGLNILPISFPVEVREEKHAAFFRILEKQKKKYVLFDWEKGELLVKDPDIGEEDSVQTISFEDFVSEVNRTLEVENSIEMLILLFRSGIVAHLMGLKKYFKTKERTRCFGERLGELAREIV